MDGMDMSAGDMDMGAGVPGLFYLQNMYWAVVGATIAAFTLVNVYSWFLCRQRLRSTSRTPAKPKSLPSLAIASLTAITRELSNVALPAFAIRAWRVPLPTLGRTSIVCANVLVLIVLCFYKFDVSDRSSFEDIGYRTGFITICQLPLLFILAGKRNIIGYLTGTSYERLNWLHRWASRCLLLTATIHMGYWFADWAPYDYIGTKIRTDPITKHGVISWAILVWITFSSMAPIRGWCYEFFVVQHIVSFAVFIAMVYLHVPAEVHYWIWICVGFFFFDRVARGLFYLYNNLSLLHPQQRQDGSMGKLWALKADFQSLPGNATRVTIRNPPVSWSPGQHVFLSCHALAPMQAHPFTISSLPSDKKMEFLIQSKSGGTRKFLQHAERSGLDLPLNSGDLNRNKSRSAAIEGPYGTVRPLIQFDTVVLLAGSTGASFAMPLMRDVVQSWRASACQDGKKREKPVTRLIRYVWIVKSGLQLGWFSEQLRRAIEDVEALRAEGHDVALDISAYITCDETFTTEQKSILEALKSSTSAREPLHGRVNEVRPSFESFADDEKSAAFEKSDKETIDVRELERLPPATAQPQASSSCGPNGTCCCTATIEDESDDDDAIRPACTCNCGAGAGAGSSSSPSGTSTSTSTSLSAKSSTSRNPDAAFRPQQKQPLLHPSIAIFSGRPSCLNVMRKSLEQARGESAVVVCGPRGLVEDVRASTVRLSDERAVHKGTGAQGIWLRTEAFGY